MKNNASPNLIAIRRKLSNSLFSNYSVSDAFALIFWLTLLISPVLADEAAGPNPSNLTPQGSQSVSLFSGAFTYTYPLTIPPGRQGVQPSLAANYNSQAKNGWLGWGWDLSFGSIQRSTKNGVPTYLNDRTDTFFFAFQGENYDLVLTSTGTDSVGNYNEYYQQIETSFLRFRYYLSLSTPTWTAWSKDGKQYSFQPLAMNSSNQYFFWGLSQVVDPSGNSFQVTYPPFTSTGTATVGVPIVPVASAGSTGGVSAYFPRTITYGPNTVQFWTEGRPDIVSSYSAGYEQRIQQRLKYVEIYSSSTLRRTYSFNYQTASNGASLLSYITESVPGTSEVHSTTFTYQDSTGSLSWSVWSSSSITPLTSGSQGIANVGDFNGDGFADLYYVQSPTVPGLTDNHHYIGLSNGSNAVTFSSWGSQAYNGVAAADFNNDGLTDVVAYDSGTPLSPYVGLSTGTSLNFSLWSSTYTGIGTIPTVTLLGAGDADGDGLPDLLLFEQPDNFYVGINQLNSGIQGFNISNWTETASDCTSIKPCVVSIGDFNGDGKIDIVTYNPTTGNVNVALSSTNGYNFSYWGAPNVITSPGDFSMVVGDFNGDGLSDVAFYFNQGSTQTVVVGLSTGNSFVFSQWASLSSAGFDPVSTLRVGDFNGDGLSDIAYFDFTSSSTYVGISTGTGFDFGSSSWSSYPIISSAAVENTFLPGDYNNDGKSDLAVTLNNLQSYVGISQGPPIILMTQITNPLGGTIGVAYTTYQSTIPAQLPFPVQVVSSATVSDGLGNAVTTLYKFSGGLYQKLPWAMREFLGFESATVTDAQGNYTVTQFLQQDNQTNGVNIFKGDVAEEDKYDSSNNLLTSTVNTWSSTYTVVTDTFTTNPVQTPLYSGGGGIFFSGVYYVPEPGYTFYGDALGLGTFAQAINNGPFLSPGYYNCFGPVTNTGSGCEDQSVDVSFIANQGARDMNFQEFTDSVTFNGSINEPTPPNTYTDTNTLVAASITLSTRKRIAIYFPFLAQTDTYIGSKHSEIQYQYDAYGNMTQEYDLGDVTVTGDERTILTDYSTSTGPYLVGFPVHKKVLNADLSTSSESWFTYDNNTSTTSQILTHGLVTKTENWSSVGSDPVVISSYDSYGNMTDRYDALWNATGGTQGNHEQMIYDPTYKQFPSTSTRAVGSLNLTETFIFDPFTGQVSSHTDVNNQTTQYQYDNFGRLVTVINSSDTLSLPTVNFQYVLNPSPPNAIISHARINSGQSPTLDSYTFYDGQGRKRESKTPSTNGNQVLSDFVDYDSRGLATIKYSPYTVSFSTSFNPENTSQPRSSTTYDGLGRVTYIVNPDSTSSNTSYTGWTQTDTDANGNVKDFVKDAYGRIILVNEHNQGLIYGTTYQYDVRGNLIEIINSLQQGTTVAYDSLNRKTSINDPQMGFWQYQYDANGNLILQTDSKNQSIQMTYDRLNRLSTKVYPDSATITYEYDNGNFGKGYLSQVTDLSGTQTLSYDNLGRIIQKARLIAGTTYYTQMAYDDTGRETSVTYPNSNTVDSYFDGVFISSIQDVQNGTTYAAMTYDSNAVGKIARVVYGNGVTTSYTYKPNNFYLNTLISTNTLSQTLQNYAYSYDNLGNITGISDSVGGMNQTFQYDNLNRVTVSSGPYGYRTYQYDSFGNLTYNSDNTSGSWGFEDLSQVTVTQGSPSLAPGWLDTGLYFNGASAAQLTASGRLSPTAAISIELWIKPLSLGTTGYVMTKSGEFSFPQLDANGGLDAQLNLTSGVQTIHVSSAVSINDWSYLVMTYDSAAIKVFVNGVFQSSQTASGTVLPSTSPVNLGSGFYGTLDEVQVHSRALSASEVLLRYQAAGNSTSNQPLTPVPTSVGMTSGQESVSYGFQFQGFDIAGNQVNYQIDWGTGAVVYPRTGYVPSGTVVVASNSWSQAGQYNIRVQMVTLPVGTTTELLSAWSPTYNIYIATAITPQFVGNLLIGAESGVSQSTSSVVANTAGEWVVSRSSSSNYQAYFGYQGIIVATSPWSALYLGSQAMQGTAKLPISSFVNLAGTSTADINTIAVGLRENGYAQWRDANGNLQMEGNRWIKYDYENRPIEVITPDGLVTTYVYDFEGNRTRQTVMQGTQTVTSSTYIGQIYELTSGTTIQYIYAASFRVAITSSGGNLFYYLPDQLGSTNLLANNSQSIVRTNQYAPFGYFFNTTGSQDSDYKFTGQRFDSQPGIYYYGSRYYDPLLGQFVSPDIHTQSPYDPQSLNRYVYCRNNPLVTIDPTGNFSWNILAELATTILSFAVPPAAPALWAVNIGISAYTADKTGNWGGFAGGLIGGYAFGGLGQDIALDLSPELGASAFTLGGGSLIGGVEFGAGGFGSGFFGALESGASWNQAFNAGVTGAAIGGASGAAIEGSYLAGWQNTFHGLSVIDVIGAQARSGLFSADYFNAMTSTLEQEHPGLISLYHYSLQRYSESIFTTGIHSPATGDAFATQDLYTSGTVAQQKLALNSDVIPDARYNLLVDTSKDFGFFAGEVPGLPNRTGGGTQWYFPKGISASAVLGYDLLDQ